MRSWLRQIVIFSLIAMWGFVPWTSYGPTLTIYALDVGQGDAFLIQTPANQRILVDGGPDNSVVSQLDQVIPFWDRRIDIAMVTHPHADHMAGTVEVLQRFKVGQLLQTPLRADNAIYAALQQAARQEQVSVGNFLKGDAMELDYDISLKSWWPLPTTDWPSVDDPNDASQIVLLQYLGFRMLLGGDAGEDIYQQIQVLQTIPDIDVLKVPHHGSATGLNADLLSQLKPEAAIIPVGKDNPFGHPASNILSILKEQKTQIWRTDNNKRITIKINKDGVSIGGQAN